jgi:hypothetical protein
MTAADWFSELEAESQRLLEALVSPEALAEQERLLAELVSPEAQQQLEAEVRRLVIEGAGVAADGVAAGAEYLSAVHAAERLRLEAAAAGSQLAAVPGERAGCIPQFSCREHTIPVTTTTT